jgi:hypothetical protein
MPVEPSSVRIGSGQIAAICGLSRWKRPMDAWSSLMGYDETPANEQIDIGNALERPIAELALPRIAQAGAFLLRGQTGVHRTHAWAKATPDFLIDRFARYVDAPHDIIEHGIIESKSVGLSPGPGGALEDWRKDGVELVPDYVAAQVQWQMEVCEVDTAYVAALLAGRELFVAAIHRDRELGADLLAIAEMFRERHILTGKPPTEADGSETYSRYLSGKFAKSNGEWQVATPEDDALLEWLRRCEAARKQAVAQEAVVKQKVQERIGGALGIIGVAGRVQWAERKAYQVAAHEVKASRTLRAKWADVEDRE